VCLSCAERGTFPIVRGGRGDCGALSGGGSGGQKPAGWPRAEGVGWSGAEGKCQSKEPKGKAELRHDFGARRSMYMVRAARGRYSMSEQSVVGHYLEV
jgi:hypothetical protein